jgi:hypothetical protein
MWTWIKGEVKGVTWSRAIFKWDETARMSVSFLCLVMDRLLSVRMTASRGRLTPENKGKLHSHNPSHNLILRTS